MSRPLRLPRALLSLLAPACALFAAGCATSGWTTTPAPLTVVELADVRKMLDAGKPLAAVEAADTLTRAGSSEGPVLAELREQGVALARQELITAFRDGKTEQALSLAASLRALGETTGADGQDLREESMLLAAARKAAAKSLDVLAAHYAMRLGALVGYGNVAASDREDFNSLLERLRDPATQERVIALEDKAGVPIRQDSPARAPARSLPLAQPIKGTLTVVVDQGLKVQNRVGIPERVLGSGFFVDPTGYILTNYHVISSEVDPEYEGYSRLFVTRSDKPGERIPAKVVGYDKILDLALLKAEIEGEYVYYPGLDVDLRPGDQVLAIGSPVSLESTVNSGIVSAVSRRFLQLGDVLQIDVPVNPGNSGGPLLDAERRVVGVVFAGLEQFQGLNFAIPTRWIGKVFPRLFEGGQIGYAWLGASVTETEKGLEVVYAVPGGPAERVGILEGDVLERIDGREVRTLADVQGYLMTFRPPVLAKVQWRSGEAQKSALVALDDRPEDPLETALKADARDRVLFPIFGMKLEKVGMSLGKMRYLVRKVTAGSQAAEIGLTDGDPLAIESFKVDTKQRTVTIEMYITKKSSGYLEGIVQLTAYLETDSFV